MKTLSIFLIAMLAFAAVPAFAGTCGGDGGGCDKDKDQQAFTSNVQYLCGGSCDKGNDDADKTCSKPKTDDEPQCGGDKGDKPAEPSLMCGGSGADKDDKTKT